jgi:hypothetical protein
MTRLKQNRHLKPVPNMKHGWGDMRNGFSDRVGEAGLTALARFFVFDTYMRTAKVACDPLDSFPE